MKALGATLEHVGIAVESVDAARRFYEEALGLPLGGEEVLADRGLKLAFFDAGGVKIELLEGLGDDPISKFIEKRGEGIMLISFNVNNTRETMAELQDKGYPFIGSARKFRDCEFAFVHPKAANGVLLEFIDDKTKI